MSLSVNKVSVQVSDSPVVELYQADLSVINRCTVVDGIIHLDRVGFDDVIFMYLLGNIPEDMDSMLFSMLIIGYTHFERMNLSITIKDRIMSWVQSISINKPIWVNLIDKPNYGAEIFKKRFWPYFNVECKDWQDVAARARVYPHQDQEPNASVDSDFRREYAIAQKYNNFLGYGVLDPNEYPDFTETHQRMLVLRMLKLDNALFEVMVRTMVAPKSCHIIKHATFWNLYATMTMRRKRMLMHFMYYTMFILDHEHTVMFSKIRRTHRIIFTHDEALCIPTMHHMHLEMNPCIQQLTSVPLIQALPYHIKCERRFQPKDVFERRFYLATGGALTNIPLVKYNAAVSGSILIPCLTYIGLEDDFHDVRFNTARALKSHIAYPVNIYAHTGDRISEDDADFLSYLEYFYPSYYSLPDKDYSKKVLTMVIEKPRASFAEIAEEKKAIAEPTIKYNLLSDIDISITTDNYDTFNDIALILCRQIQQNCAHIGDVWYTKIYNKASFKYKIYGPGLMRPIDLFRVSYGPDRMVKKFHCPIVRSWYDGANAVVPDVHNHVAVIEQYWAKHMWNIDDTDVSDDISGDLAYSDSDDDVKIDIPPLEDPAANSMVESPHYVGINIVLSCLQAVLSGINNNYKWFFNNKPCVEVILKYAQRGFSTIITPREIEALRLYMAESPKWAPFLKDADMCGLFTKEHIFFSPGSVNAGIRYELRKFTKADPVKIYSHMMYVGVAPIKTDYGVSLAVKATDTVYKPDLTKLNKMFASIQ
jgi:hypothetical protein